MPDSVQDPKPPLVPQPAADATDESGQGARHYVLVRHRHNWLLLWKFSLVGGSGTGVNLAVFSVVLALAGHSYYHYAAVASFLVANSTNYLLNKYWTFQERDSDQVMLEYGRFLAIGVIGLALNLVILTLLVRAMPAHPISFIESATDKHVGQLVAIVLVTPVSFIGNKLWTFRAARLRGRPDLQPPSA